MQLNGIHHILAYANDIIYWAKTYIHHKEKHRSSSVRGY